MPSGNFTRKVCVCVCGLAVILWKKAFCNIMLMVKQKALVRELEGDSSIADPETHFRMVGETRPFRSHFHFTINPACVHYRYQMDNNNTNTLPAPKIIFEAGAYLVEFVVVIIIRTISPKTIQGTAAITIGTSLQCTRVYSPSHLRRSVSHH